MIKTIIITFQHSNKLNFLITKKHCDLTMIQCEHTYYWFLQRLSFYFFQIDDLIEAEYVFLHFICTVFCDEMFVSIMIWMYNWNFQTFQNESLCKCKWKNYKISKSVDLSLWNNWLFIKFFLIFMRFIFNFFYSINDYSIFCGVRLMADVLTENIMTRIQPTVLTEF